MASKKRCAHGAATIVSIAFALLLTACGGGGDAGSQNAATAAGGSATIADNTPQACQGGATQGGAISVGHQYDVANLNPLDPSSNGEILVQNEIYSGLVRSDPDGDTKLVAGLADKWDVSEDRLTWTFHLRDDAAFSDGSPVTADDVKFSLDRFADPKINVVFPSLATGFKNVTTKGDDTVLVHLTQPVSALLHYVSLFPAFIVPKAQVTAKGDAFFEKPIGAGPWMIKSWKPGSSITLVPNEHYWEKDLPRLDEVTYEFVTSDNTRLLKLRSGELDVAEGVPFSEITSLNDVDGVRVQSDPTTRQEIVWLNHRAKPLDDVKVRRALSMAIDREQLNQTVYQGVGEVPNSILPKLAYGDDSIPPLAYDVEQAKKLIGESSVPDGFSTTLMYPGGDTRIKQLVTIIQQEWKTIGVDLKLIESEPAAIRAKMEKSDYDMVVPQPLWSSDVLVPDEFATVFADPTDNGTDAYFSGWKNAGIWDLVQQANEGTEEQREALWPKIQQLWIEDMPSLSIMWLPSVTGIRDSVCDVKVNALGIPLFEHAWKAE